MSIKNLVEMIKRNGLLASMEQLEKLYQVAIENEQKLAESESRCAALAAENAGMKATSDDRRMFIMNGVQLGYIKVPTVETDPALEAIRVAVSPQEPTPSTDAFLAEVRAQGVEMFAASLKVVGGHEHPYSSVANEFAAQLRQEAAQ